MNRLRERTTATLLIAILMISIFAVAASVSAENPTTIESSTMHFTSVSGFTLTPDAMGGYSGVIPMIVGGGYDIYAKEGALAWFGDDPGSGPVWTDEVISDHDAWSDWNPDTPDWYQYSLHLYYDEESGEYRWAIRNHSGTTANDPWYDETAHGEGGSAAHGVPMSGVIVWRGNGKGYAYETEIGAYLPSTGTPEIPGGAATKGGGAACWDMDWSWGSEVVPLEYPGFEIEVTGTGGYHVTLTPARAHGPTPVIIPIHQAKFQWRAYLGMTTPFGTWNSGYNNYHTILDFDLSGNVLHGEWSYSPPVTAEEGASSVWVYNKKDDVWINKEGTVNYMYSGYGTYEAVNYFRGYIEFSGTPSQITFERGVAYQWVYIYEPQNNKPTPQAHWDSVMDAWLVGWSIYIFEPQSTSQSYYSGPSDPWQFAEPVPASNYYPVTVPGW